MLQKIAEGIIWYFIFIKKEYLQNIGSKPAEYAALMIIYCLILSTDCQLTVMQQQ